MDQITVPAGTIIHINGMPFELPHSTPVLGRADNYRLAISQSLTCCDKPIHAPASLVTSSTRDALINGQVEGPASVWRSGDGGSRRNRGPCASRMAPLGLSAG
ncbi:MAG: hypothetical protein KBC73_13145, partial [Burkholderiaceae bacterium]|nr:hypothetical protein [Burkholderiaceae bacterium]